MEYVDGEDLASLLRRIGRFSREKALDIVLQLTIGLAAAHELGVLHRDLKPANIMVDGHGRVRIMDFGVAGFAREMGRVADLVGTLSYMAPEQLAGKGATLPSDVYSLGLVFYELLTGRRPYGATDAEGLLKAENQGPPPVPSSLVRDLDPEVERVVMWCLEADPSRRPASAQVVARALPGGDPLALAMAAGETPSPETVAAAGGRGGMRLATAVLCLAGVLIGMLVVAGLNNRTALFRLARLDKPPVVLADRAREITEGLGLESVPAGRAFALELGTAFLRHTERNDSSPDRWQTLKSTDYTVYSLWYRESPWPLVPYDTRAAEVTRNDPPMETPGMAYVRLDADGRLLDFEAVPTPVSGWTGNPESVDWSAVFREAGIEPSGLEKMALPSLEIEPAGGNWQGPHLSPEVPVDYMAVWTGPSPWGEGDSVEVRAGAYQGKPVFFSTRVRYGGDPGQQAAPDSAATAAPQSESGFQVGLGSSAESGGTTHPSAYTAGVVVGAIVGLLTLGLVLAVLVGGPFMAWRHLRTGKGDRRGALRFGLFAFGLILVSSLLSARHAILIKAGSADIGYEMSVLVGKLGTAVLYGGYVALAYLALEPYVRRHWPDALISWTRLLRGRFGDPLVGRDLLLGSAVGVLVAFVWQLRYMAPAWFGAGPPRPFGGNLAALEGGARAISVFLAPSFLIPSMLGILALIVLVIVVRRRWLALALFVGLILAIGALAEVGTSGGLGSSSRATFICLAAIVLLLMFLFIRSGLLALTVAFFFFSKIRRFPLTLDSSAWYAGTSTWILLALAAIAVYAFRTAIRGRTPGHPYTMESGSYGLPPASRTHTVRNSRFDSD
jgi:hypothetical protein